MNTTKTTLKVKNFYHLNQFIIEKGDEIYFQSYDSLIAKYDWNTLILGCDYDYSITTLKHLYLFINDHVLYWLKLSKKLLEKAICKWSLENEYRSIKVKYDEFMK